MRRTDGSLFDTATFNMERCAKRAERAFTSKEQWWFLDPAGFGRFKTDPVAQGYEVISRHPGFPFMGWTRGIGLSECHPWNSLTLQLQDAVFKEFKAELKRMRLITPVFVGDKAVSFDCTVGHKKLIEALEYEMKNAKVFEDGTLNIRVPDKKIDFITSSEFRNAVTLNLERLTNYLVKLQGKVYRRQVVSAIETFLTKSKSYRSHRKAIGEKFRNRDPRFLALACVAWDWRKMGRLPTVLTQYLRSANLTELKLPPSGRWDEHFKVLEQLHDELNILRPVTAPR